MGIFPLIFVALGQALWNTTGRFNVTNNSELNHFTSTGCMFSVLKIAIDSFAIGSSKHWCQSSMWHNFKFSIFLVSFCIHKCFSLACLLWLSFTAFSSVAISAANHADSRASLASLESNPSTNEKNSERTDTCEKVHVQLLKTVTGDGNLSLYLTRPFAVNSTDHETFVFDWINSSFWQVGSSWNSKPSYVFPSHHENHFRR